MEEAILVSEGPCTQPVTKSTAPGPHPVPSSGARAQKVDAGSCYRGSKPHRPHASADPSKLAWRLTGAPCETTVLYMSFQVKLEEGAAVASDHDLLSQGTMHCYMAHALHRMLFSRMPSFRVPSWREAVGAAEGV